ncbi:MAG TPA: NAD-dependent succinate-semialdehyde dehydrogenase [Polyangia bacterium]|nr:NAD-dependent succinate-semialdehyde dehydrogenase [Polyangia bacterium]
MATTQALKKDAGRPGLYDGYGLYIDGQWTPAKDGGTREVIDPATEESLGTIPVAGAADLDAALAAARRGFEAWRRQSPWDRSKVLRRAADLVRERTESIARVMSAESGKPLAESRAELAGAADQFDWYADETRRLYGYTIEGRTADVRMQVRWEPVGVVAAFTAWNFPAVLPARKIAAALGAGCSIILKPAEEAPGSCMALAQACHDAGLVAGALNIVTGEPAAISEHLVRSPIVRKVSLTGSVPVGKRLLALAAEGVKRVTMELGGHAPVLVFDDADLEKAVDTCARTKFRNCGQVCISPTRFYVQERIYAPFAEAFAKIARGLKIGPGLEEGTQVGPMANARGLGRVQALVDDARGRGARVLTGGGRPAGFERGYYYEPTVLGDVPDDAKIMVDEPFGPLAPLTRFSTLDEVVARANALPYGLAGYVFSSSLRTATLASEALEVGMVGVNEMLLAAAEAPFGGVKESGMGREGGALGVRDYLEPKLIKTRL